MTAELTFHAAASPFVALTVALVALAVVPALHRGDPVVRLGFVLIGLSALPWAATTALIGCLGHAPADGLLATPVSRAGFAPIALVGSGLLMVILGVAGKVDAHRSVLVASVLANTAMMVVCAATDAVVASMQLTPWGLWYPRAGALYGLHVGSIPICVGYGIWAARGSLRWGRADGPRSLRAVIAVGALAVIAVSDVFLTYGMFGVYPWSWLPSLVAVGVSLYAIGAGDVLRSRGLDPAAAIELGLGVLALVALTAIAAATAAPSGLAIAAGLVAAALVAAGRTFTRATAEPAPPRGRDVDALADELGEVDQPEAVARALAEFLDDAGLLAGVRVWLAGPDALTALGGKPASWPLPAEVRAYLVKHERAFPVADLATARLGSLRPALEAWVGAGGAAVIVPLCDRDQLLGVCAGDRPDGRALRDGERELLDEAARVAARALTVLGLRRSIEARTELTRELELAEAVRQARSASDRRDVGGVQVAVSYQQAARVAGDLWYTAALPDGRLFVLIGDVAGRGTPAALVSAAVVGACQSAIGLAAPESPPAALLAILHEIVMGIDGGRHRVTVLGATVDRRAGAGTLDFAIAGHRGGYLLRRSGGAVELTPLVGQGAPLGEPAWRVSSASRALAAGDVVILTSDGVTHARDRGGQAWGERRLQRALREHGPEAGVELGDAVVAAVTAHASGAALDDDLLIISIAI